MLRVPESKKATSGIISSYFGSLKGHWGAHGCPKGIQGGLEYPFTGFLTPFKVSYNIRFGFKHHMMAHMADLG